MNLSPPPENGTLEELQDWCDELYQFLKYPTFHVFRMVPRSTAPDTVEGNVYYDSDDNKLKVRDDSTWQDTY